MRLQPQQQGHFPRILLVLIIFLLIANSIILAHAAQLLSFPGQLSAREQAQQGGLYIYEYVKNRAQDAGVESNLAVRDVLARFKFEIEQANRPEEVAQIVLKYGRESEDIILREQENLRRGIALSLVRQDPKLQEMTGETYITITRREDTGLVIEDPQNLLSQSIIEQIEQHEGLQRLSQIIEIKIVDGKADLVTPVTMLERLKLLEHEVDSLRSQLQSVKIGAGLEPMTGSGIIVRLYDAEPGVGTEQIVHDFDVRDIVNELFAAGAAGIAVNNQRLTTTSSIRCAGPVILVNHQPIAVNPVTISAIGDPIVLASSLDLIQSEYQITGIRFEIEHADKISLPSYGQN
ncbi:MAG: DUF881 domain-containing protein [bacterium]|jgi:uncharacterized protein YlxW (UPF0749 family)